MYFSSLPSSFCRMTTTHQVGAVQWRSQSLALRRASSGVRCFRQSLLGLLPVLMEVQQTWGTKHVDFICSDQTLLLLFPPTHLLHAPTLPPPPQSLNMVLRESDDDDEEWMSEMKSRVSIFFFLFLTFSCFSVIFFQRLKP